jgi:hypothetical protein
MTWRNRLMSTRRLKKRTSVIRNPLREIAKSNIRGVFKHQPGNSMENLWETQDDTG